MKIRAIPLLIFILLLNQSYAQTINATDTSEVIIWTKDRPLTIEDFVGEQDPNFIIKNYPAEAATFSKIKAVFDYDENGHMICVILTEFHKSKSWMTLKDEYTLNHEQKHFDITEIYARKARKEIGELIQNSNWDLSVLESTFDALLQEWRMMQNEYDSITAHGNKVKKQKDWNRKLLLELEDLKEYEFSQNVIQH